MDRIPITGADQDLGAVLQRLSRQRGQDVVGLKTIQLKMNDLERVQDFLDQRQSVRLIGKTVTKNRAPTVAFTVEGREPEEIAAKLAKQKIGIGNGNCYAYRLMEALGIPPDQGVVRLSFVHYTNQEEQRRLMEALDSNL